MVFLSRTGVLATVFFRPAAPGSNAQTSTGDAYRGVQIEFPPGGQLRIENTFGSVTAEGWKQKYIYVTTSEAGVVSNRSSVVIENRNQGFAVRVFRRRGAAAVPIDLNIKIPETAQVEVIAGSGAVSLRNPPASTVVKSVAGNVSVELLESTNLDIAARSSQGLVRSRIPQLLSDTGHVLQARLGTGSDAQELNPLPGISRCQY